MATPPAHAPRCNGQIAFSRTPPGNPSHIQIADEAVSEIAKVAGLDDAERKIVARALPHCLLIYYVAKASKGSVPTILQRDQVLHKLHRHLREASRMIRANPWVERAMISFEVSGLSGSRAAPYDQDFDEDRDCGTANIKQELEQLDTLLNRIKLLEIDPILQVVAKRQSKMPPAKRDDLEFLHLHIHILWARSLGKKVIIGERSKYFAFARAISELIGETKSDERLIELLRAARHKISSLSTGN